MPARGQGLSISLSLSLSLADDHDDDDYVVAETIDEDQSSPRLTSAGWLGYIAFPKKDLCQQTWLET